VTQETTGQTNHVCTQMTKTKKSEEAKKVNKQIKVIYSQSVKSLKLLLLIWSIDLILNVFVFKLVNIKNWPKFYKTALRSQSS